MNKITIYNSQPYSEKHSKLVVQSKASLRVPNIHHAKNGSTETTLVPLIKKTNRRLALQEKISGAFSAHSMGKRVRQDKIKNVPVKGYNPTQKKNTNKARASIGIVSVYSSRNNTLLTLSKSKGRVVKGGWASAGSVGFKNSRKSSTYASQAAAKSIALLAKKLRIYYLHVKLNGMGRAKGAVVRVLQQSSLKILAIRECTPMVHNGCRPPKIRRI